MTRSPFDTDDEPPPANGAGTESVAAAAGREGAGRFLRRQACGNSKGRSRRATKSDRPSSDANAGTPAAQSSGAAVAKAAGGKLASARPPQSSRCRTPKSF